MFTTVLFHGYVCESNIFSSLSMILNACKDKLNAEIFVAMTTIVVYSDGS